MHDDRPPRLVRAYYASRERRRRALVGAAAVFDGVWLGLLDEQRLGEIDEHEYRVLREPHDGDEVGYDDERWTQRGLADWERDVVERWFPAGGRLLVPGAGGGREVLALRRMGFDAVGFEPNRHLVRAGDALLTRLGHPGVLRGQPRSRLPRVPGTWDGVIVGWGAYHLIPGRAARVRFLRDLRAHVGEGAPILVSTWLRARDAPELRLTQRVGTTLRRLRGREPVELGDVLAPNYAHRFTREELEAEVADGGFVAVEFAATPYGRVVARAG